jgi:N-acetylglucosamine kinase-like BadF-type ATPase
VSYVIGIDGGGTKTLLKIADSKQNLLATCQGGPSNIYSNNLDAVKENLRHVIHEGLAQAQIGMDSLSCVCLGTAGAGRERERGILIKVFNEIGINCDFIITHDAVTALYGALGKGEGIILISGTGSICYGRKADGTFQRTGGWGHVIGDEGSGYDIGRRILTQVMWSYDGRASETSLTAAVLNKISLDSPEDLVPFVYNANTGKSEIAAFARLLDPACLAGDKVALQIARDAAHELFLCIKAVMERLKFQDDIGLVLQGSVLEKGQFVKQELVQLLNHAYPSIQVKESMYDAAWGAVLMALESL